MKLLLAATGFEVAQGEPGGVVEGLPGGIGFPRRRGGGYPGGGQPYPGGQQRRIGGGTCLYDSVVLASDDLMRKQKGRKALILLTDGVDTGSRVRSCGMTLP